MADPAGGPIVCHNDVCLENVVFREGIAVGLLDFDFAARLGWEPADRPTRLRLVADAYGLDAGERRQLFDILGRSIARGGEFLHRRIDEGDPNFTRMWNEMGGATRFERRQHWWDPRFL